MIEVIVLPFCRSHLGPNGLHHNNLCLLESQVLHLNRVNVSPDGSELLNYLLEVQEYHYIVLSMILR